MNNEIEVNYHDEDLVKLSGVMARYIKEVNYEGLMTTYLIVWK